MKLESFNVLAVVIYLAVAVLWDASRKQSSISWTLLKRILWLAFLCGSVLVISWRVVRTVEESNWGKGIRAGKAYILPWVALDEERHGTLPHRSDVLLVPHYASTFMASYSHIIDVAHPGNKFWNEVVQEHVVGFAALPPLLQQQYCTHLIESIAAERRFLEQGSDRLWYNVTDAITLSRFCRKEILRAAHPLRGALSHELHSLRNDVDFGMFRSTGMQSTQIRDLLDDWETAILPYAETNAERIAWQVVNIQAKRSASFRPTISTVANAAKGLRELEEKSATGPSRHGTALPPRPSPSPPTPYAWLQEGDRINVMEGCNPGGVQYPGVIVATFPSHNFFDIEYDTGETDEEVKQRCVIPETEED